MSARCDDDLKGMMMVSSGTAIIIIDGKVGGLKSMIFGESVVRGIVRSVIKGFSMRTDGVDMTVEVSSLEQ